MPRIYDGNSYPIDYCKKHFPKTEQEAIRLHYEGEGPDGRGNCFDYDTEHPPYDDGMGLTCFKCNKVLTSHDD